MRLAEEYLLRNSSCVPLVNHAHHGSVLLVRPEVRNATRWLLCVFDWEDDDSHPGTYLLNNFHPIHDSYQDGKLFIPKHSPIRLEWDEYEDYFLRNWLPEARGYTAVRGSHRDVVLAAWEMFLYCYDSWFVRQSHSLKELVYKSIDTELPFADRYLGYQDTLVYLTTHFPQILKAWKYNVLCYFQNYSDWLAKLVEQECLVAANLESEVRRSIDRDLFDDE